MLTLGRGSSPHTCGRIAVVALAAGLLALLYGCSSPEPSPVDKGSSKPTSSKSASASPSPTKSASPSAARGNVEAQLQAATVAFYAAVNQAYRTLDTAPIDALTVPGSGAGKRYIDYIKSVKSKGHRFRIVGSGLSVRGFKVEPRDADAQFEEASFTLVDSGAKELDKTGKAVEVFSADSWSYRIEFQKAGGKWLVLSQRQAS